MFLFRKQIVRHGQHRTRQAFRVRNMSHHRESNRLIHEKSPYLLQHAYNPVDWYPWGEEAFARAKSEDKPIFLSVGYSTCHWCHVMEKESFESEQTAQLMNKYFVNIKVDREERPDVDRVYMSYVQATTGGGGWPMSVFLTPDLKPVFGGTYFPPNDGQYGTPGFSRVLHRLHELWVSQRDKLLQSGNHIIEALREHESTGSVGTNDMDKLVIEVLSKGESYLQHAAKKFENDFDGKLGGFGAAPKFPRTVILNLLFRLSQDKNLSASQQQEILHSCLFTLEKMAQGGIYDQLGWGFHRYSVDSQWHVPHFEKMLYDQAQLVQSYLDAFQITRQPFFSQIAKQLLDYVIRDMTFVDKNDASCAAFFGAEDADSLPFAQATEKKEGAFYVWTFDELKREFKDEERFSVFCFMYGVGEHGNVSDSQDPHGELANQNVLTQRKTVGQVAKHFNISEEKVLQHVTLAKNHLFTIRAKRPKPHLDDKIITSWNGMMLGAFARASQVLPDANALDYVQWARRCAQFIEKHLYNADTGTLFRTNRDGETNRNIRGFLSDYCCLISGLIDLYEASGEVKWIKWAYQLQEKQNELFLDKQLGCTFFDTDGLDKSILLRQKEYYDASGNSISSNNLIRLATLLDKDHYNQLAIKTISMFHQEISSIPHACPQLMCALEMSVRGPKKLVLVYKDSDQAARTTLKDIYQVFQPNRVLVHLNGDQAQQFFTEHSPYLQSVAMIDDKPTALICAHHACQIPTTVIEEMKSMLTS